jgi:hypothetical protein
MTSALARGRSACFAQLSTSEDRVTTQAAKVGVSMPCFYFAPNSPDEQGRIDRHSGNKPVENNQAEQLDSRIAKETNRHNGQKHEEADLRETAPGVYERGPDHGQAGTTHRRS